MVFQPPPPSQRNTHAEGRIPREAAEEFLTSQPSKAVVSRCRPLHAADHAICASNFGVWGIEEDEEEEEEREEEEEEEEEEDDDDDDVDVDVGVWPSKTQSRKGRRMNRSWYILVPHVATTPCNNSHRPR